MPLTKEDVTEELCIAPPQMSLLNDIPSPKTTPTTLSTKGPKSPTESYFDGVSNPLSKKASAHLSPLPSPGGGGRGGSHGGGDSDNTLCFVVLPDEDPSSPVTRVPSKHNCRAVELPRSSVNIIRELNNLTLDGSNQVDEDKRSAFLLSPADVIDDESSYCSYVNKVHSSNAMSTVEGGVQKSGVQMRAAMGVARLLDCIAWKVLVMIATFHLLFDHDLYLLVLPKQADHVTLVATSFVAGILLAELFLNLLVIGPQYFTQLFFYLDLIAWVTVLPDVFALWGYDVLSSDSNAPNLAIARVSRVVRIAVRLGRIGQLAKHINKLQSIMTCGRKQEMQDDFEDCLGSIEKSQVGREIEEKLTKKNVFFTLVLILGTFMLSDPPANDVSAEEIFLRMYIANPTTESLQVIYLELGDKLLSLECNNTVDYYSDAKEDHRTADIREIEASFMGSSATVSISKLSENKQSYIFSVCLTVFVIVCLLGFNYAVAYDVQRILVSPIERLSHLVKMFMTNPLAKFNWKEEQVTGETGELIKSMKKLGNLIQVGFGEAGAEIVSQNLRYGSLFTVFPGKNMQAIFSFCDIRDFTSATEILRHDVMFFVNYVAEIVHKTVQECGGRPNKNIGDAFLCIWRLGDMEAHPSPDTLERYRVSAENALYFTFLVRSRIAHSDPLRVICEKVGNSYSCNMGFGLHFGWAVEGAIGSHLKVDVSYLSPHVNAAARLEAATKQYGVKTLMSASFLCLLSRPVRDTYTRPVDVVVLKGTAGPVVVHEGDSFPLCRCKIDTSVLPGDVHAVLMELSLHHGGLNSKAEPADDSPTIPVGSLFYRDYLMHLEAGVDGLGSTEIPLTRLHVQNDNQVEEMVQTGEFDLQTLSLIGHALYVQGSWECAGELYKELNYVFPNDAASTVVHNYMEKCGFSAPKHWQGFRELMEK